MPRTFDPMMDTATIQRPVEPVAPNSRARVARGIGYGIDAVGQVAQGAVQEKARRDQIAQYKKLISEGQDGISRFFDQLKQESPELAFSGRIPLPSNYKFNPKKPNEYYSMVNDAIKDYERDQLNREKFGLDQQKFGVEQNKLAQEQRIGEQTRDYLGQVKPTQSEFDILQGYSSQYPGKEIPAAVRNVAGASLYKSPQERQEEALKIKELRDKASGKGKFETDDIKWVARQQADAESKLGSNTRLINTLGKALKEDESQLGAFISKINNEASDVVLAPDATKDDIQKLYEDAKAQQARLKGDMSTYREMENLIGADKTLDQMATEARFIAERKADPRNTGNLFGDAPGTPGYSAPSGGGYRVMPVSGGQFSNVPEGVLNQARAAVRAKLGREDDAVLADVLNQMGY